MNYNYRYIIEYVIINNEKRQLYDDGNCSEMFVYTENNMTEYYYEQKQKVREKKWVKVGVCQMLYQETNFFWSIVPYKQI